MTEYCCSEFEKAVDYEDFRYYKVEDNVYHSIKRQVGTYDYQYSAPIARLGPFKFCPWCVKELKKC